MGRAFTGPAAAFALSVALSTSAASADCVRTAPWERVADSAAQLGSARPLLLLGAALLSPAVLATTGIDHSLRVAAQRNLGGRYDLEPISVAAPYVLVGGLVIGYGVAAVLNDCELQRVESALLQSLFFTGTTVAALKWSFGRQWPNAGRDPAGPERLNPETATEFTPFRAGLAAFPSGHVAMMFGAASALRASLPARSWWRWLGYPLAFGTGAGMWLGDHHWASDIVAGGALGEAIGGSIGQSFGQDAEPGVIAFLPFAGGGKVLWFGEW